jgi:hypothetical protein
MNNPYEAPRVLVADVPRVIARRPRFVTVALVLLWILLVMTALGCIKRFMELLTLASPFEWGFAAYLCAIVVVPAWLLVKIGQGRNWARIAATLFYGLNLLFRLYLLVNDRDFSAPAVSYVLVPAMIQALAFLLLYLPRSQTWFHSSGN